MANLRKCSRCKSEIDISYFGMSRKKEPYKTCDNCRKKLSTTKQIEQNNNMTETMTSNKYWCSIDATDIAVIVGLHRYNNNIYSLVMKYWKRSNYDDYTKTYGKIHVESDQQVETRENLITQICMDINIGNDVDTDELLDVVIEDKINAVCEKAKDECNDFPNDKKLKALSKIKPADVTSFCNKQMGIRLEKTAIERYEHEFNVKVDALSNYVKKEFYESDHSKWWIGGRVDGMIGIDKVVEVKNRKNRLFDSIPVYEKIQLSTYMYSLNVTHGVLVQMFKNVLKVQDTHLDIVWFENIILNKLQKFCKFMDEFVCDDMLKESFMSIDETDDILVETQNEMLNNRLCI